MPTYIGFSTINVNHPRATSVETRPNGGFGDFVKSTRNPGKKYTLTDEALVLRDLVNALNIRQGEKVGQPQYGTTLWSFIFEPNTPDVQSQLETEIKRVISNDPRLVLNYVTVFPQEHGILIEVELAISPFNNAAVIGIFFDSFTSKASLQ